MKTKCLIILGLAGLGAALAMPASAGVSIGVSIGIPLPLPPAVVISTPPPCPVVAVPAPVSVPVYAAPMAVYPAWPFLSPPLPAYRPGIWMAPRHARPYHWHPGPHPGGRYISHGKGGPRRH
ncbi:MAG: hypothetical protein JXQ71_11625 [Verrucomicrobia bacterium]|nr:hypothetical protein [Verrucomicrobiota bacterium]